MTGPSISRCIRRLLPAAAIILGSPVTAQQLHLPVSAAANDSTMAAGMRRLARQVIAGYPDTDRDRYLDNLGRLQIAAGEFSLANLTFDTLRRDRLSTNATKSAVAVIPYEIYARARSAEIAGHRSFPGVFRESYRDVVGTISDSAAAYELVWALGTAVTILERNFRDALARLDGTEPISQSQAIDLIRRYVALTAYSAQAPLIAKAQDDDDRRRYLVDKDVLVKTPEGASICVLIMRPRTGGRFTALLNFSIYADQNHIDEARLSASRGYAGVSALSRGKGCSPDSPMPFEHDGVDAAAVIDWIAGQSWSDGRVGMFGGSYDGFAQWAAAKHHPKALKALMPSVAADPGLGFPMEGGVFMNYSYPYPFYVTDVKSLDEATYFDSDRWNRLNAKWYAGGRSYAALDSIDGTPNPIFDNWLAHPGYDEYWRRMIPYGDEFAGITIPVLTTTGYYDSGQEGALHFFNEHFAHDPSADHYLVIGPYDHVSGQRGMISPLGTPLSVLRGYAIDSVAQIEIPGLLRYSGSTTCSRAERNRRC